MDLWILFNFYELEFNNINIYFVYTDTFSRRYSTLGDLDLGNLRDVKESFCLGASQVAAVKNLPANAGDVGLVPGLGRCSGGGNGNPLQYSCLGNPMDREAW